MSKFLISTCEIYRVDTAAEVEQMLEEAKEDKMFDLGKYSCQRKEIKAKGEVIETYYRVSLTKNFTSEKEPEDQVIINYER